MTCDLQIAVLSPLTRCKYGYYDLSAHLLYTKDVTCCKTHFFYCHEYSHTETQALGSWNRASYNVKKMRKEMCYQNRSTRFGRLGLPPRLKSFLLFPLLEL